MNRCYDNGTISSGLDAQYSATLVCCRTAELTAAWSVKMRLNFVFLLAFAATNGASDKRSGAPRKTVAMKKEQLFRDFFPLTRKNFTEAVIRSRMAWVVFLHQGMLDRSWKQSAAKFRGILRFGMIHRRQEAQLLKELVSTLELR